MKIRSAVLSMTAVATVATAAYAATFDPTTGTGFVGKGELQTPWGWNNATLQKEAEGVTFKVSQQVTYEQECSYLTGGRNPERVRETKEATRPLNSRVTYETRNNKRGAVTGFILDGFGSSSGPVPTDLCTGRGAQAEGPVEEVDRTAGTLKANHTAAFEIELEIVQ